MRHAIPWGTVVPRGTTLCGATLRPPEVKLCRIIWCIIQREHVVENRCDLPSFKCFQRLLSMQFIQNKSFWTCYCAFYKDILHFLNQNTAPLNKINNWTKWQIFTWYPVVRCMSLYFPLYSRFLHILKFFPFSATFWIKPIICIIHIIGWEPEGC